MTKQILGKLDSSAFGVLKLPPGIVEGFHALDDLTGVVWPRSCILTGRPLVSDTANQGGGQRRTDARNVIEPPTCLVRLVPSCDYPIKF